MSFILIEADAGSLCEICQSLNISVDKFVIKPDSEPDLSTPDDLAMGGAIRGTCDLTGLQTVELGFLNDIYRKQNCSFCRLVFHATHGDNAPHIGIDGLDRHGKRINCYVAWQLDARESSEENPNMHARTRRMRVFNPDNAFPDAFIALVAESPADTPYLGRRANSTRVDLALIRKWLELCSRNHREHCHMVHDLVEIDRQDGSLSSGFRLIDVQDYRIVPIVLGTSRFVALSYIWGAARDQLLLTKTQLAGFQQSLLPHRLPRTIKDAIDFTAAIGERYLWVDALCIIQDDSEDKAANISIMDKIYGKAALTICAATGSDSDSGLSGFRPYTRDLIQPVETIGRVQLIVLRSAEIHIQNSMWNSRGWTFQERLLSKCCLIFTKQRVFYQCQEAIWSEETYSETPNKTWTLDHVGSPLVLLNDNPIKRYAALVEMYTARNLTFESDALEAFSGILQSLEGPMGTGFYYGLPATYFDWALLWEPKQAPRRREGFPSWSWVGWSGQSGWNISTVSGVLLNLHQWLTDRTWIVWAKQRPGLPPNLILYPGPSYSRPHGDIFDRSFSVTSSFLSKFLPRSPDLPERWRGYNYQGSYEKDPYGRSICKNNTSDRNIWNNSLAVHPKSRQLWWDTVASDIGVQNRTEHEQLVFSTYTARFLLSRHSMSTSAFPSNLHISLNRFGIQDVKGDWCGTIVLDNSWFNKVGGIFEFIAISEAKDFSLEEYDSWSYYVPKEREQSEWDLYYSFLIVEREGNKERAGLAKVYKHAFHYNSFSPGCQWKEIRLN